MLHAKVTWNSWQCCTWYLYAILFTGTVYSVCAANWRCHPEDFEFEFKHQGTIAELEVMHSLRRLEVEYPGAGLSLLKQFIPGELPKDEKEFWEEARLRIKSGGSGAKGMPAAASSCSAVDSAPSPKLEQPARPSNH